jgi:hypothetical protein
MIDILIFSLLLLPNIAFFVGEVDLLCCCKSKNTFYSLGSQVREIFISFRIHSPDSSIGCEIVAAKV